MTDTGTEGTVYELAYLVTPLLPEQGLEAEVATIKARIEAAGGTLVSEELPKMRYLAYTISRKISNKNVRFNEAYFGWMRFRAAPAKAEEIREYLGRNDNLVRSLLMVAPLEDLKKKQAAEALLRPAGAPKEDGAAKEEAPKLSDQELDREIDQLIAA